MQTQYEIEEEYGLEDLKCGSGCSHFDALNQCCWLSWCHQEEGDYCAYGLKVDENGLIVYPDLSAKNQGSGTP